MIKRTTEDSYPFCARSISTKSFSRRTTTAYGSWKSENNNKKLPIGKWNSGMYTSRMASVLALWQWRLESHLDVYSFWRHFIHADSWILQVKWGKIMFFYSIFSTAQIAEKRTCRVTCISRSYERQSQFLNHNILPPLNCFSSYSVGFKF